jgi:hypothetical protein
MSFLLISGLGVEAPGNSERSLKLTSVKVFVWRFVKVCVSLLTKALENPNTQITQKFAMMICRKCGRR